MLSKESIQGCKERIRFISEYLGENKSVPEKRLKATVSAVEVLLDFSTELLMAMEKEEEKRQGS